MPREHLKSSAPTARSAGPDRPLHRPLPEAAGSVRGMTISVQHPLRSAVAQAVGQPVDALEEVRRTPLEYDAFLAHREVNRLRGRAVVDGERLPWSLIEKRTEGPGLASPYLLDNGRREFDAYASGALQTLPPGIRAPRAYGALQDGGGGMTLWLEEVHHQGSRPLDADSILAAARDLGAMNGRWMGGPFGEDWHFTGWIDRHSQPEAVEEGLATLRRRHPDAVDRVGAGLAATERLIRQQSRLRSVLEALPQTLCHHDAVGANVFRTGNETVLIDWESVGAGPVGADLASLIFASVRRGDAPAGVAVPLVGEAVGRYAEGLWAESPGGSADIGMEQIRLGFDAAIGLRWKLAVDVVAGLERGQPPRRGSLPDEDPAQAEEELLELMDLLLASAQRVLG